MNKLVVFVEGYTEVVFVEKLIEEIAGKNNVLIEHREIRGGSTARRTFARVRAAQPATGQKYFVMIVDCGGDRLVKERILEEHENLTKSGYSKIIGLRDVRPDFTFAEVPKLEAGLPKFIKTSLAPVEIFLAVMEIEAWFLAEATHFPRIDPAITVAAIKAALGFDPENDPMDQRPAPADDLGACYGLAGKSYQKHAAKDTVEALAFELIYFKLLKKFVHLERFIESLGAFLAS